MLNVVAVNILILTFTKILGESTVYHEHFVLHVTGVSACVLHVTGVTACHYVVSLQFGSRQSARS